MKYKRDNKFIESIPEEWRDVPVGTVCIYDSKTVVYAGPSMLDKRATDSACVIVRSEYGGVSYSECLYKNLTPVEAWEPKEGEVVAAWDDDEGPARLLPYIGPNEAGGRGKYPHKAGHTIFRYIARVPDDMLAKDFPAESAWWIANGELYEADHE